MNVTEHLREILKQIPELPGIYKMLDADRNIIYIGKSKFLKKRVRSYFTNSNKWEKVAVMVTRIQDIEYIVTDTHLEARLLECKLIKEYQPRFNAQMKNDKRYIFIKIDTYNPFHSISVVNQRDSDCIGPFRSKYSMEDFLKRLKSFYPITKEQSNYVFEYHLFPVKMDKDTFEKNRLVLLDLFSSGDNILSLIDTLQGKLEEAAASYRFEMATVYRDLINSFSMIQYCLDRHNHLASKDLLLKLPLMEGYKLFYISDSYIIHSEIVSVLTKKAIKDFLKESQIKKKVFPFDQNSEKSHMDYRDILYSELSDLPEEMVELL